MRGKVKRNDEGGYLEISGDKLAVKGESVSCIKRGGRVTSSDETVPVFMCDATALS